MPTPYICKKPSEHTIENLANHFFLDAINNPRAWVFCPTTNEEIVKGYDASFQNTKQGIVQYKAISYIYANGNIKVKINNAQLITLKTNFPNIPNRPYVFYAYCKYKRYYEIQHCFSIAPPQKFFENCIYINAHDIPDNTTHLDHDLATDSIFCKPSGTKVQYLTGPEVAERARDCSVFARPADIMEPPVPLNNNIWKIDRRLSVIIMPMPRHI